MAEYDGEIIGCCILDLISLAHMKTEYLANMDPGKLPKELQLSLTEQEEEFHRRYWEAQSKLIATLSSTDYMETKYGVTGISTVGGEPIKLVFTRKSFEGEEFVTADLEEILEEMLWCKKVSTHALNTLREEMEAMGFGGPPACFEIFYFILHPGFDRQEVGEVILGYVEDQAASRGMTYIVASEEPDYLESREFYRTNGYTDLHQPSFEYKHAGRKETCLLIKKLPRGEA